MKKFLKIMLCIMGSLLAVIVLFWCCISYAVNYKKTTCDTSVSPNKKYELTLQAVGEPDWPFGWFKTNKTPCYAGVFPVSFSFK